MDDIQDGYDLLIEAMILGAISDYKFALKYKDREATNQYMKNKVAEARKVYVETREFFHSDFYNLICKIDGDRIMKHIEEEVASGKVKRLKQPHRKTDVI